jgi:hypothetical protein
MRDIAHSFFHVLDIASPFFVVSQGKKPSRLNNRRVKNLLVQIVTAGLQS